DDQVLILPASQFHPPKDTPPKLPVSLPPPSLLWCIPPATPPRILYLRARGCAFSNGRAQAQSKSAKPAQVTGSVAKTVLGAERVVLVFDAEHAPIAGLPQVADVFAPLDIAVAGNGITPPPVSQNAHVIPPLNIDQAILRV